MSLGTFYVANVTLPEIAIFVRDHMEFIRKTSATVRAVSSSVVELEIGYGERVSLSHVSHQVAGLLLAAGELDVEIHIRPKKGIALSSRVSGKDDTLIFPDLFISDTEVRINAQKIAIGDQGTETATDASDKSDASTTVQPGSDKAVVNDVATEWRIKRDEAIAEGVISEFHSTFGVTGPNDAFISAYRLMVGDIVPSANSATSEDAPADEPEETVVPSEEIEPAPVAEPAAPLATFDPKGTVTVSEPTTPAQETTTPAAEPATDTAADTATTTSAATPTATPDETSSDAEATTAPADTTPADVVTPATEEPTATVDSSDASSAVDTTPTTTTDAVSTTPVPSGVVDADAPVAGSAATTDVADDSVQAATVDPQVIAHLDNQVSAGVPVPTSLTTTDATAPAIAVDPVTSSAVVSPVTSSVATEPATTVATPTAS